MLTSNLSSFEQPELSAMTEEFFREGYLLIPNILSEAQVEALRVKTDEFAANPDTAKKHLTYAATAFVLRYCHELDPLFQEMTVHPAILQIVQSVLGNNARFNAMNIIRNSQGQAISNWHVP